MLPRQTAKSVLLAMWRTPFSIADAGVKNCESGKPGLKTKEYLDKQQSLLQDCSTYFSRVIEAYMEGFYETRKECLHSRMLR